MTANNKPPPPRSPSRAGSQRPGRAAKGKAGPQGAARLSAVPAAPLSPARAAALSPSRAAPLTRRSRRCPQPLTRRSLRAAERPPPPHTQTQPAPGPTLPSAPHAAHLRDKSLGARGRGAFSPTPPGAARSRARRACLSGGASRGAGSTG